MTFRIAPCGGPGHGSCVPPGEDQTVTGGITTRVEKQEPDRGHKEHYNPSSEHPRNRIAQVMAARQTDSLYISWLRRTKPTMVTPSIIRYRDGAIVSDVGSMIGQ